MGDVAEMLCHAISWRSRWHWRCTSRGIMELTVISPEALALVVGGDSREEWVANGKSYGTGIGAPVGGALAIAGLTAATHGAGIVASAAAGAVGSTAGGIAGNYIGGWAMGKAWDIKEWWRGHQPRGVSQSPP